jgi:Flp pilus assembly pilin Flp
MYSLNNKGQALVEYVLIIVLITVIAVGAVSIFGGYVKDAMTKTGCELVNEKYIKGEKPGKGTCKQTVIDLEP